MTEQINIGYTEIIMKKKLAKIKLKIKSWIRKFRNRKKQRHIYE